MVNKIKELEVNGESKFVVRVDGNYYEFKVIEVAGDIYKVVGGNGFGYALRVFNLTVTAETIANEFVYDLKGLDLKLEFATFVSPIHFV